MIYYCDCNDKLWILFSFHCINLQKVLPRNVLAIVLLMYNYVGLDMFYF